MLHFDTWQCVRISVRSSIAASSDRGMRPRATVSRGPTAPDVAPIDSYGFVPLVPRADSLVHGRRHMPLHPLCERTAASVPKGHSVRTKSAMDSPLSLHVVRTVLELFQKLAIQAFELRSGVFGDLTPWPATADLWSHRISSTAPSILRWHGSIPQSPPCLPALGQWDTLSNWRVFSFSSFCFCATSSFTSTYEPRVARHSPKQPFMWP